MPLPFDERGNAFHKFQKQTMLIYSKHIIMSPSCPSLSCQQSSIQDNGMQTDVCYKVVTTKGVLDQVKCSEECTVEAVLTLLQRKVFNISVFYWFSRI